MALRAVVEHRDGLVKTRTQTVNPLHVALTHLIPAGASRNLTAERAAELLRGIRPRDAAGKTLPSLAADLVTEVGQLDRRITKAAAAIQAAVTESGTTLTDLCGIGSLTAGKTSARSARSVVSVRPPRSRSTPVRPRSKCLPEMLSGVGSPVRAISTQPLPARHGPHPTPAGHPRQTLLPAEADQRQGSQGSDAPPQTAALQSSAASSNPAY